MTHELSLGGELIVRQPQPEPVKSALQSAGFVRSMHRHFMRQVSHVRPDYWQRHRAATDLMWSIPSVVLIVAGSPFR